MERDSRLHLTLKSSASLVVDKLSFTDAKQMKLFLDTLHQNGLPLMEPENDWHDRRSQKAVNETLPPTNRVKKEIKNRGEKRKSKLPSRETNADRLEENSPMPKKIGRSHLQHKSNKRKILLSLNLQEKHRNLNTFPSFNTNTNGDPDGGETVPSFNTSANGYPDGGETVPSFNTNANGYPDGGETVPSFSTNTNGYPDGGETVPSFNTNANGYPGIGETVPSFNTNTNGYPGIGETVPSFNTSTNGDPDGGETVPSFNTNANGYPGIGETVPSFNTSTNGYPDGGETVPSFNTNTNGDPDGGEAVPSFNTNANGDPDGGETVPSFNTSANGYPGIGETVPSFNTNANGYPGIGETVPSFNTNANGYPGIGETVPSFNTNANGYPDGGETVPSFNTSANGYPGIGETVPSFNTNANGYPGIGETVPSFNTSANGDPGIGETVPSFNTNANGYAGIGETVPSFNTNANGDPDGGETVPSFNTSANGYPGIGETVPSFNTSANGYPDGGETVPSFNTNANGYPGIGETIPSFNTNANGDPDGGETVPSFNTSANGYPGIGETVPSFNTNANGYPGIGETVPSFNTNANGYPGIGETVPSFNISANGDPDGGETVPSFNTNANGYPGIGETVPSFNTSANGDPGIGETVPSFNTNANGYAGIGETIPSFNTNANGYPGIGETVPSFNTNANGDPGIGETVPSFNTNANGYPGIGETVPSFNTSANGYPGIGETVPSFNTSANGYPDGGETVPSFNTNANGYPGIGETIPSFNTNANGDPDGGETVPSFNTSANGYPGIGETVPSFNTSANGDPDGGKTVPSFRTIDSPLESEHIQVNPSCSEALVPLDTHPTTPREGFPNLGNTCYMNAVLQSLFAIPSLADDLFTQGIPWEDVSNRLIVPFSLLFALKDISEANTKGMLLLDIKNAISDIAAIFCGNGQHDAHEFLGQCLDQLKEDMRTLNTTRPAEMETQGENSRPHLCAGDATTKVFVCPIAANFELELQVSIVCRACGRAAVKTELNNYLSINLDCEPKAFPLSLQDYFDFFFIPEEVECHCEKCGSMNSVFTHKFRRLPRVLIVHLKRYSINEQWLLVKNCQQVKISKYLSLSFHCDDNTKPPLPLDSKVSDEGRNVLAVPGMFGPSKPSMKLTTESSDPAVLPSGPDEGGELQIFQGAYEGARNGWQQQRGIESGSKLELVTTENGTLPEKKLPAPGSMVNEGDSSLSMICQFLGIPCAGSAKYPDLKNHEETSLVGESAPAPTQLLEDNPEENKMIGGFQSQGVGTRLYQNSAMRSNKEIVRQSPPPGVSKLDAQEDPEKGLGRSSGQSPVDNPRSLPALGSKKSAESENTVAEGKEAKSEEPDDLQSYRLVSVISHIGNCNTGHYISDVYDFQKQAWFFYSDMWVSEISEAMIQKLRLRNGYIFFYMHNKTFEALLEKNNVFLS